MCVCANNSQADLPDKSAVCTHFYGWGLCFGTYLPCHETFLWKNNNAPLLWAADTACCGTWNLKHSLRGDVLCSSKCTGEWGMGAGLYRQSKDRQQGHKEKEVSSLKKKNQTKKQMSSVNWNCLSCSVLFSLFTLAVKTKSVSCVCRCLWIS